MLLPLGEPEAKTTETSFANLADSKIRAELSAATVSSGCSPAESVSECGAGGLPTIGTVPAVVIAVAGLNDSNIGLAATAVVGSDGAVPGLNGASRVVADDLGPMMRNQTFAKDLLEVSPGQDVEEPVDEAGVEIESPEMPNITGELKMTTTVSRRQQQCRRTTNRGFRRAAERQPRHTAAAAKDYAYTCAAAGVPPFPATEAKIQVARQFLIERKGKSAHRRSLAWRKALDALDEQTKTGIGLTEKLTQPRGKRFLNAAPGTFRHLEQDIADLATRVSRPLNDVCEEHEVVDLTYVQDQGRRMCIMATVLLKAGKVSGGVRLADMTSKPLQRAYIEEMDRREAERKDQDTPGAKRKYGDSGYICDNLKAARFFAVNVQGKQSPEAEFALAQQRARPAAAGMTDECVTTLTKLLDPDCLRAIRRLPADLLAKAQAKAGQNSQKDKRSLAQLVNLAGAIALQPELLLKPGDLVTLRFDSAGSPILPDEYGRADQPVRLTRSARAVLDKRRTMLEGAGLPWTLLFPGKNGSMLDRSVAISIGKLVAGTELEGVTLQHLRDLGAILLLRDNPRAIRRVATLLAMKDVRTVQRRYAPFLRAPRAAA